MTEEDTPVENKRSNTSSTNNSYFTSPNQNPSPPSAKRKKWSSPSSQPSSQKRSDFNESKRQSQSSSNSANLSDIIPVISQVKVEMPEFLDPDSGQIDYSNSEQEDIPLEEMSGLEHSTSRQSGSSNKEESLDVYGGNSSNAGDITGEQMTPAELSKICFLPLSGPYSLDRIRQ